MLTFRLPKRYFSILFSSFRLSRAKRRFVCCCLTAFSARARVRCRAFCRDADLLLFQSVPRKRCLSACSSFFGNVFLYAYEPFSVFSEPAPFGAVLYSILYIGLFRAFFGWFFGRFGSIFEPFLTRYRLLCQSVFRMVFRIIRIVFSIVLPNGFSVNPVCFSEAL